MSFNLLHAIIAKNDRKKALDQEARNVCAPLSKGARRPDPLQLGRWLV
jgi:hypothetical protein